jgi:hypothetical protein
MFGDGAVAKRKRNEVVRNHLCKLGVDLCGRAASKKAEAIAQELNTMLSAPSSMMISKNDVLRQSSYIREQRRKHGLAPMQRETKLPATLASGTNLGAAVEGTTPSAKEGTTSSAPSATGTKLSTTMECDTKLATAVEACGTKLSTTVERDTKLATATEHEAERGESTCVAVDHDPTPGTTTRSQRSSPSERKASEMGLGQSLLWSQARDSTEPSPSKSCGDCDAGADTSPTREVSQALEANPCAPYNELYDSVFSCMNDVVGALKEVGYRLAIELESKRSGKVYDQTTKEWQERSTGGNLRFYGCASAECALSQAHPFQLVLHKVHAHKGTYLWRFRKSDGQHKHGSRCSSSRRITPAVAQLRRVKDYVRNNPNTSSRNLLRHLVHELKFTMPDDATLSEAGHAKVGGRCGKLLRNTPQA